MKWSMRKKVVMSVGAVALVGIAVAATFHGVWNCDDCTLQGATPDPNTVEFIRTVANEKITTWQHGDTITICNSTHCAAYVMSSVFGGIEGLQQFYKVARSSFSGVSYGGDGGAGGGSTSIVGYRPIYQRATVCVDGVCTVQDVLIGYEPIYGRFTARPV